MATSQWRVFAGVAVGPVAIRGLAHWSIVEGRRGHCTRRLYAWRMRMLYSLLLLLARPLVHARLYWRGRAAPGYRERIGERFGHVPASVPPGLVWIHTVSAGETIAAAPLVRRLIGHLRNSADSDEPQVLVTTMTPTGSAEVRRLFGDTVAHVYAPYDFPDAVTRFLAAVQPRALVLMETEIWPNLISQTADRGVPVALINARLSERSARRYGYISTLIAPVLRRFAWIACQYSHDAERFRTLGVSPAQLDVAGSVKFDVAAHTVSAAQQQQLELISSAAGLAQRNAWIAGSTHLGEDELLLAAHAQVRSRIPDACLIIVPRHPERFAAVAALASDSFATARASQWLERETDSPEVGDPPAVVVVDLMGLLRPLYGLADVAFIGASLVDLGGHNPIEPAAAGLPLLMGPGRYNFAGVCAAFEQAGALTSVADSDDVAKQVIALFSDPAARQATGQRALTVVAENAGATDRLLERLTRLVQLPDHLGHGSGS